MESSLETDNYRLQLFEKVNQDDYTFENAVTRLYEIGQQGFSTSPSPVDEVACILQRYPD